MKPSDMAEVLAIVPQISFGVVGNNRAIVRILAQNQRVNLDVG